MELVIPEETKQSTQHMMRRSITDGNKLCLCGRVFEPYRPYQRFCNEDCRNLFWKTHSHYKKKDTVTKTCKECGESFDTNDGKRRYCKDACYLKHELKRRKPKEKRTCLSCGETFKTSHWSKRYCNDECRKKARNAQT